MPFFQLLNHQSSVKCGTPLILLTNCSKGGYYDAKTVTENEKVITEKSNRLKAASCGETSSDVGLLY
jgi:hypothetical protein